MYVCFGVIFMIEEFHSSTICPTFSIIVPQPWRLCIKVPNMLLGPVFFFFLILWIAWFSYEILKFSVQSLCLHIVVLSAFIICNFRFLLLGELYMLYILAYMELLLVLPEVHFYDFCCIYSINFLEYLHLCSISSNMIPIMMPLAIYLDLYRVFMPCFLRVVEFFSFWVYDWFSYYEAVYVLIYYRVFYFHILRLGHDSDIPL